MNKKDSGNRSIHKDNRKEKKETQLNLRGEVADMTK